MLDEWTDGEDMPTQSSRLQFNQSTSGDTDGGNQAIDDQSNSELRVQISDALSEKERVKFTIKTVTSLLGRFAKPEFSVERTHEEFIWLADRLGENSEYAGLVLPAPPPTPDFAASRDKLARLSDGETSLTREEFQCMKAELEAEYLATFKKTVAMHEAFLQRIAEHKRLREDEIFKVFLEFEGDLSVRGRKKREMLQSFMRSGWQSLDDALLSTQKEKDEFFLAQRTFITSYYGQLRLAVNNADKMNRELKNTADACIRVSSTLQELSKIERSKATADFLYFYADCLDRYRKLEGRMASDSDLKLSDTLHYYAGDCVSAKDLMYRRARALADYETANKELERARQKGKEVEKAETAQEAAYNAFNDISESARIELTQFKDRWVAYLQRSLVEHTELQAKHAKAQCQMLERAIQQLKEA